LRQTPDPQQFGPAFTERLDALARAHGLLTETEWRGAPLDQLIATALKPFLTTEGRIAMGGPAVAIRAAVAVTLSLVLHELATNAVKHGALSEQTGRLQIAWTVESNNVTLLWSEICATPVRAPTRKGFGTRLVTASASQLGGLVSLDFTPEGLVAQLSFEA
jgi:two-component sensor histidine kinase